MRVRTAFNHLPHPTLPIPAPPEPVVHPHLPLLAAAATTPVFTTSTNQPSPASALITKSVPAPDGRRRPLTVTLNPLSRMARVPHQSGATSE